MENEFVEDDVNLNNFSRVWILIIRVFFLEDDSDIELLEEFMRLCVDLDSSINEKEMERMMKEEE